MPWRIRRTPANIVALVIIVVMLGAWSGLLLLNPGERSHQAEAHTAEGQDVYAHVDHAGPPGWVADQMRTQDQAVGFCISAALEPFQGAVAQIREIGPVEAGERFRRCMLDTIFDHASEQTLAELESHRQHFTACFGELANRDDTEKAVAVAATLSCVKQTTAD